MRGYLRNITLALDIFLNVLTGGKQGETISVRAGKAKKAGNKRACYFCKFLHWVDHNHCEKALESGETGDDAGIRFMILLFLLLLLPTLIVACL
jgi:hypothetical protein